jgi:ATP-dependent helicase/nuclease subunit B
VPLTITGATLQLRLDRVDRLRDARRVVIDYKSGAATPFDPWAQRPAQPQLPAYASAVGDEACAVASVHLGTEALKLRGVADRPGRIRGVHALPEAQPGWPQLRLHWQQQLQLLLQEFLSGQAAVQPQAHACDYCHLSMLCRIDPAAAQLTVPPDSEEGEEGRFDWRAAEAGT